MLFDIPFIADWQKIGKHRQQLTDLNNAHENEGRIDYDYTVGHKVLLRKEDILHNAESRWHKKTTHWKMLFVDLIGPYTLKGQDGSSIDFMCLTMIDPTTSWFKIVELPTVDLVTTVPPAGKGKKVTSSKNTMVAETTFDKSSAQISNLVYKTWFSRYPPCRYLIYNNGSKFKLHFQSLCNTYGIKRKPTSVKNPQVNPVLERIYAVLGNMLRTSELDMAETVKASDIDIFLSDAAWAVCSTYHTLLIASPGAAIFG
jgi:hypothetical protein